MIPDPPSTQTDSQEQRPVAVEGETMTPQHEHDDDNNNNNNDDKKPTDTADPPTDRGEDARSVKKKQLKTKSDFASQDSLASGGGGPQEEHDGHGTAEDEEDNNEWSKLRCGSLTTEELVQKEREKEARRANRQNRCADYPGFAFGSAMFGSDTTMKFNIIKNELHNIMRSQLKRVDGEVNAFSARIKEFDRKLEESERLIRTSTGALADAVALHIEDCNKRRQSADDEDEKESSLSAFDQHVLFLEGQLREARIRAGLNFQILDDCDARADSLLLGGAGFSTSLLLNKRWTTDQPPPPGDTAHGHLQRREASPASSPLRSPSSPPLSSVPATPSNGVGSKARSGRSSRSPFSHSPSPAASTPEDKDANNNVEGEEEDDVNGNNNSSSVSTASSPVSESSPASVATTINDNVRYHGRGLGNARPTSRRKILGDGSVNVDKINNNNKNNSNNNSGGSSSSSTTVVVGAARGSRRKNLNRSAASFAAKQQHHHHRGGGATRGTAEDKANGNSASANK